MKDVGKFYGHLVYLHFVYFIAVCYILCLFWYIFSSFGILYQENSGNPALKWNALMRQQSHQAHPKLLLINMRQRDQCYKIGSTFAFRKSMYIHMYIHTYVCTCICIYLHMYTHTYVYTYICIYLHMYIHTYVASAWSLICYKNPIFQSCENCHATEKSEAIARARRCGHP
jgi:hypothetical protein